MFSHLQLTHETNAKPLTLLFYMKAKEVRDLSRFPRVSGIRNNVIINE